VAVADDRPLPPFWSRWLPLREEYDQRLPQ
jgi:hypothetical protein